MKQLEQPPAPIEAIAKSQDPVEPPAVIQNRDLRKMNIGPILVLDVRRTEAGRNSDPIGDALRTRRSNQRAKRRSPKRSSDSSNRTCEPTAEENASILYLQVTRKEVRSVLSSPEGGPSGNRIGWLENSRWTRQSRKWLMQFDPTQRRFATMTQRLQLFSDGGVVDEFTATLASLTIAAGSTKQGTSMPCHPAMALTSQHRFWCWCDKKI